MGIKVKYYYSACVGITTPDVSILCDPWFTDGIYDGSWYQFPKFDNPLDKVGKYDLIYISHIHPDHYDPIFLRKYLEKYPDTKIVARETFLKRAILSEGFKLYNEEYKFNETEFEIFFNDTESTSDIDTALVVKWRDESIVNMNDNAYNEEQISEIKKFLSTKSISQYENFQELEYVYNRPSIALLGYTGAGPYPQTYYADEKTLIELANHKKQEFFRRYKDMDKALNAKINIPFAGQYILGGKFTHLNQYRGIADAIEVLDFDRKATVLQECAELEVGGNATSKRYKPYKEMDLRLKEIENELMDYEKLDISLNKIPFMRLLNIAYERAISLSEYTGSDYMLVIKSFKGYYVCNLKLMSSKPCLIQELSELPDLPRLIIETDPRHLFGLLTGLYHWNNAIVGSHLTAIRQPDIFNREVDRFLNFFHI